MTTANKTVSVAEANGLSPAKPRKSPVYKLSPEELNKQVIALETKEMQLIHLAIGVELKRRADEYRAKLEEIEGEK